MHQCNAYRAYEGTQVRLSCYIMSNTSCNSCGIGLAVMCLQAGGTCKRIYMPCDEVGVGQPFAWCVDL